MKQVGRTRRNRALLITAGVAAITASICSGLSVWLYSPFAALPTPTDLPAGTLALLLTIPGCLGTLSPSIQEIQQYGRFSLPRSAKNVLTISDGGFGDCTVYTRFEIVPADLHTFMASTLVTSQLVLIAHAQAADQSPLGIPGYIKWWDIDPKQLYWAAQGGSPSDVYQWIAVDESNPTSYVVYVVTFLA
jgi:hypothetical protein